MGLAGTSGPAHAPPGLPSPSVPAQALHTRFSRSLVLLAIGTGAAGLALGNPMLLVLAATVAALLHAARAGWPGHGEVSLELSAARLQRGRSVRVALRGRAGQAPCAYWLHLKPPEAFVLEEGSNLHVLGAGERFEASLALACRKRGAFPIGPATLTAVHPQLLAPSAQVAASQAVELTVEPRVRALRGAKAFRAQARLPLGEDRGRRGPGSVDFRELREYERGDPLKAVNWKATAKRSTDELQLMVNEYEPEARKNVWFFLDLAPGMEAGTTLDNALEDAIETTLALVHHFAGRGHRVGGTTYNGGTPLVFYPDAGTRQHLTIARGLAHVQAGQGQEGLPAAVERVRGFLSRERPTVFVVTRPELDPEGLAAGARRLRAYAASLRPQRVFVLAPVPAAGDDAAASIGHALLALEARARLGGIAGVRVLPLRHGVRSLHAALAKGVLGR